MEKAVWELLLNRYSRPMIFKVSGYYSQLQLVEEFLLHERELSLETDTNKNFFEAWEKESESTLIFLQENGQAISAGGTKMRIDMPSKLLLDLKNGYNIGKLVRLDYDQKKKRRLSGCDSMSGIHDQWGNLYGNWNCV